MQEQFIPYELALKLKELGLDGFEVFGYYNLIEYSGKWTVESRINPDSVNYLEAPLWQQAESFLRTKMLFHIVFREDGWYWEILHKGHFSKDGNFKTYEEARQDCLEKLIELCKEKIT